MIYFVVYLKRGCIFEYNLKQNIMTNLKNTMAKIVITGIVLFILFTLAAVTIELFKDLDYLNRLF